MYPVKDISKFVSILEEVSAVNRGMNIPDPILTIERLQTLISRHGQNVALYKTSESKRYTLLHLMLLCGLAIEAIDEQSKVK